MIEVYDIDELSDVARKDAYANWLENDESSYMYDVVYDECVSVGKCLGIIINDIQWCGFHSQGDGAMFIGSYTYNKNWVEEVLNSTDNTIIGIGQRLHDIHTSDGYDNAVVTKSVSRYCHENTALIDVTKEGVSGYEIHISPVSEELRATLREFMKWIYKQHEDTHMSETSEERFLECSFENSWEYTQDGTLI
jgi:hypothetical protein